MQTRMKTRNNYIYNYVRILFGMLSDMSILSLFSSSSVILFVPIFFSSLIRHNRIMKNT